MNLKKIMTGILLASVLLSTTTAYAEEATESPVAVTATNTDVSPEILHMMVRHMDSDELFVEADGWLDLLKKEAAEVYKVKISVKEINDEIDALTAQDTNQTAAADREVIQQKIADKTKEKSTLLEELTNLRAERKVMTDRLDTVLKNINEKIGTDEKGQEKDKVLPYRRYIDTVSGISLEVTDAHSAWTTISGWVMSEEGGIHWMINIAKFLAILLAAWFISRLLGRGARRALEISPSNSQLLNDFIANIIYKVVMLIGLLVALAALEVNVGPIMAMVGAAGFVVAFALQGTLSNFASGIMLMLYRPYDIGDNVEVAGIMGTVKSMTLVSTSIMTADNRLMVVPNNSIWGDVITNATHSETRRVDMTFGIGYNDNIEQAEQIMKKILSGNPLVLKEPEPVVTVNELADSSVNFICRPWVETADYWTVYGEITRAVKEEFDKADISIPYPQMDIHLDPTKA